MKKSVMISIIVGLILINFVPSTFADNLYNNNIKQKEYKDMKKVLEIVEQANDEIYQKINEAQNEAEVVLKKYKYNEEKVNKKINIIGKRLIQQTNTIAKIAKKKCENIGVKVICDVIEVELGSILFSIDPLRICGF